jgi:hypothetical protein
MKQKKINNLIIDYILNNYDKETPIFTKDIYQKYSEISRSTIRSILSRLVKENNIVRIAEGIYSLPNYDCAIGTIAISNNEIINKKYIRNDGKIFGYRTGISFANKLGLTTQTAGVDSIISNCVANKKREVKLNKTRVIVNSPRVEVTANNYKLLQILDLLNDYTSFSEINLEEGASTIFKYLEGVNLERKEVEKIVNSYPREAQVNFYKIRCQDAITSKYYRV